jgi:uncharacterized protein with HEPN domain
MKEKKQYKNKTSLSEKALIEYILGSLEIVKEYLKNYTRKKFQADLKIQDAVCHRMYCIGVAATDLSTELKQKYSEFPWLLYIIWATDIPLETIWDLAKTKQKTNEDFGSLHSLYSKLEEIYLLEYYPSSINSKKKNINKILWSIDYQFPIKTKKSIWTVKNK